MKDWTKDVDLLWFCQSVEAHPTTSEKRFRRVKRLPADLNSDVNYFEVGAVAIHIPVDRLDDFLEGIDLHRFKEIDIRNNVPAVKKAYEQYRMLLKMCGGDHDARY